jgi:lipopolysaccharide transport system ATP-binding protein
MDNVSIRIENLSKKYYIGKHISTSLRESITNFLKFKISSKEEFWALKNISLDIESGDVLGIIGKNGAGKSTLLKVLSRITLPTTGRIEITGKVSSLLEVGTGFHPELSGRENVFLNGTILGMTRREIKAKFDEIVAFSGIEKFIDTPVKRYSSGMYVRLAFAVAAHLDPEILIIDEVLAVGDADFQKKCLGKMSSVARQGRTVIFVSHNMSAVSSLCNNVVFLEQGQIKSFGKADDMIRLYMKGKTIMGEIAKDWMETPPPFNTGDVTMISAQVLNTDNEAAGTVNVNTPFKIRFTYEVNRPGIQPVPNVHIFTSKGEKAFTTVFPDVEVDTSPGKYSAEVHFPANFLNEETYTVGFALSSLNPVIVHAADYEAFSFDVIDDLEAPTRNQYKGKFEGVIRPLLQWNYHRL